MLVPLNQIAEVTHEISEEDELGQDSIVTETQVTTHPCRAYRAGAGTFLDRGQDQTRQIDDLMVLIERDAAAPSDSVVVKDQRGNVLYERHMVETVECRPNHPDLLSCRAFE